MISFFPNGWDRVSGTEYLETVRYGRAATLNNPTDKNQRQKKKGTVTLMPYQQKSKPETLLSN
jgi:hypothetical protein